MNSPYCEWRREQIGGVLAEWTLQTLLDYFVDTDTQWRMDDAITWRSLTFVETFTETLWGTPYVKHITDTKYWNG